MKDLIKLPLYRNLLQYYRKLPSSSASNAESGILSSNECTVDDVFPVDGVIVEVKVFSSPMSPRLRIAVSEVLKDIL